MWVGFNPCPVRGRRFRGWAVVAMAAILAAGCSSNGDKREDAGDRRASEDGAGDVLAEFEAWANDSETAEGAGSGPAASAENPSGDGSPSDGVLERFNRKVGTCWKQPFGMPRLATVRLLVQFNPDGTVREVTPRPEAGEAIRYRTEVPYLVMVAQTSRALRQCQPYDSIKANFPKLSQVEMTFDPRNFRN